MNKLFKTTLVILGILIPTSVYAAQVVGWNATSTTSQIAPNAINSVNPNINVLGTGTSTFMGNVQVMGALDAIVRARTVGNLLVSGHGLIGTSVDTSVLSVGTNTTASSGGISFGTDAWLYRSGTNGSFTLEAASNGPVLKFKNAGTAASWTTGQPGGGGDFSFSPSNQSGAALTLQQNAPHLATFGGSIITPAGSTVGIASSTPAGALGVQGNAIISGNLTSVANITATGTLSFTPDFSISRSNTTRLLLTGNPASGTSVVFGDGAVTNGPVAIYAANGASQIAWGNNASLSFGTNAAVNVGNGTITSVMSMSGSAPANSLNIAATTGNISTVGSIGIASTTPSAPLSITGVSTNNLQFYISSTTATVASTTLFAIDKQGNILTSGTPPLSVTCAATCAFDGHSNDMGGTINISGAQTSVTVNFKDTKPYPPHCVVSDSSTATTYEPTTISTTQVVFTTSLSLGTGYITYYCPL